MARQQILYWCRALIMEYKDSNSQNPDDEALFQDCFLEPVCASLTVTISSVHFVSSLVSQV